jgi:cysteine-rich repeat protein
MKKSIAIATFVVIGAGATTVAALPNPYQGSDTLFNVTQQAIPGAGLGSGTVYIGGGSGNAASAMTAAGPAGATQQTGPMSRMLKSEAQVCNFGGGGATAAANASGIVIGLDAVDVLSSTSAGGATTATCNGTADNQGTGTVYSGSPAGAGGYFAVATSGTVNSKQTWKWALAMIYGGLDLSQPSVAADCNSAQRKALVANWSNAFQAGCANGAAAVCGTGTQVNGALWHAYRRDDTSGTSDVFASILGLATPSGAALSNAGVNGFGATMYCNAMNWETNSANAGCGIGPHDQFLGPGGIPDPASVCQAGKCGLAAGAGNHRMPPTGSTVQVLKAGKLVSKTLGDVWGRQQDPNAADPKNAWDVLPTQMQDNDPIRRPCIGTVVGNVAKAGEEVCNVDGSLGLVVPMVDTDWVALGNLGKQFATNQCDGTFAAGNAPQVFSCAFPATGKKVSKHGAECPNTDNQLAGLCQYPIDATNNSAQCINSFSNVPQITVLTTTPNSVGQSLPAAPDGRIYNAHLHSAAPCNGATAFDGNVCFLQYNIASIPGVSVDMTGAYNRIHQQETMWGSSTTFTACQLQDMTDQIGCLTQADPCSIGYAGDGSKTWFNHNGACAANGGKNCPTAANTDSLRIAQTYPTTTTVQKLGLAGEYQLTRKLYFNSVVGFSNVAASTGDSNATQELTLAKFESTPSLMNPIMTGNDFFTLGPQAAAFGAADAQFCEDFNEQLICAAATNNNGCAANANAVIPGSSTVPAGTGLPSSGPTCGNGTIEAYEECDPSAATQPPSGCSATCRCKADFNEATGACN